MVTISDKRFGELVAAAVAVEVFKDVVKQQQGEIAALREELKVVKEQLKFREAELKTRFAKNRELYGEKCLAEAELFILKKKISELVTP